MEPEGLNDKKFEFRWKTTCLHKVASISNSWDMVMPGFCSAGHISVICIGKNCQPMAYMGEMLHVRYKHITFLGLQPL